MADIDIRVLQRSVIEFLNAESETPLHSQERLKDVYSDVSTVKQWVRCNEVEGTSLAGEKRSSSAVLTAVTPSNIQRVDDIICGDCRMDPDELYCILSLSKRQCDDTTGVFTGLCKVGTRSY
ncbi:hypothetical protein Trydic_g543 [Trypoxylus dichotomus]